MSGRPLISEMGMDVCPLQFRARRKLAKLISRRSPAHAEAREDRWTHRDERAQHSLAMRLSVHAKYVAYGTIMG